MKVSVDSITITKNQTLYIICDNSCNIVKLTKCTVLNPHHTRRLVMATRHATLRASTVPICDTMIIAAEAIIRIKRMTRDTWETQPQQFRLRYLQRVASHATSLDEFRTFISALLGPQEYHLAFARRDYETLSDSRAAFRIAVKLGILMSRDGHQLYCVVSESNY